MRQIEEIVSRQVNRWNSITQTLHYAPGTPAQRGKPVLSPLAVDHPVICISRDLGSGARDITRLLCERLGYQCFGRAIIDEIAKDLNVQRQLVDSLDEFAQNALRMILASWLQGREIEMQEYLGSLVRVIETLAMQGGMVILGRGASFILKEKSALNAQIVAPLSSRVRRLMQYEHLDEKTAKAKLQESDHSREHFIRQYFHQNLRDTSHFDLTINTDRLSAEDAVEVILAALARQGYPLSRIALPGPA